MSTVFGKLRATVVALATAGLLGATLVADAGHRRDHSGDRHRRGEHPLRPLDLEQDHRWPLSRSDRDGRRHRQRLDQDQVLRRYRLHRQPLPHHQADRGAGEGHGQPGHDHGGESAQGPRPDVQGDVGGVGGHLGEAHGTSRQRIRRGDDREGPRLGQHPVPRALSQPGARRHRHPGGSRRSRDPNGLGATDRVSSERSRRARRYRSPAPPRTVERRSSTGRRSAG